MFVGTQLGERGHNSNWCDPQTLMTTSSVVEIELRIPLHDSFVFVGMEYQFEVRSCSSEFAVGDAICYCIMRRPLLMDQFHFKCFEC